MDEWIPESRARVPEGVKVEPSTSAISTEGRLNAPSHPNGTKKRKRSSSIDGSHNHDSRKAYTAQLVPSEIGGAPVPDDDPKTLKMSEEEYDLERHKQITARRNFDKVIFSKWSIRTWYFSPYPLMENELESEASSTPGPSSTVPPIPTTGPHTPRTLSLNTVSRGPRASTRLHGRTSDLLAGGLARERTHGPDGKETESMLWVCDRCFKYMTEGAVWEGHSVSDSSHFWVKACSTERNSASVPADILLVVKCINVGRI